MNQYSESVQIWSGTIKRLLKTTAFLGSSSIINSGLLLVKNKILALFLGPTGVGLIAQLTNFSMILQNWAAVGMNTGVVKFVSEYQAKKQYDRLSSLLVTFTKITLISSLIFVGLGVLFSKSIARIILNEPLYAGFVILVLSGLPFLVFYNFFRSVFRGFLQIKLYVAAGIGSLAFGILILIPLVYWLGLPGAVWQIPIVAIFGFILSYFLFRKHRPQQLNANKNFVRFNKSQATELLKYGAASLVAGSATLLAMLTVRTIIVSKIGLFDLGLFQAAVAISTQSIQILLETLSTYSYPRISGLLKMEDIREEINQSFRMAVFFATVSIFFLLLFKEFAILILYSEKFSRTAEILPFQLLGDFLKVIGWSFWVALLPLRKLKAFMTIDVIWSIFFVALSFVLIPPLGLKGAVLAYLLSYLLHSSTTFLTIRRATAIKISPPNRNLFMSSVVLLVSTALFFHFSLGHLIVFLLIFAIWAKFSITAQEWQIVKQVVKKLLRLSA